jgi:hypothetical protein
MIREPTHGRRTGTTPPQQREPARWTAAADASTTTCSTVGLNGYAPLPAVLA